MARGRGSGRKTDYDWFGICGSQTGLDLADTTPGLGSVAFTFNQASTVTRIRGMLGVQMDATAVEERAIIAFGLIVVSENAFAAGVASVPHPHTDSEASWIWHNYVWLSSGAEAAVNTNSLFARVEVDTKAMRKVKNTERLVMVGEVCSIVDQGGTWDFQYGLRLLAGI